ncbi:MAG: tetratricopeptide repeat protein [Flavobacteriales bacterium]
MNEDRDDQQSIELVHRYERMLELNASYYFDVDQLEVIVDHYCSHASFQEAEEVIAYGYSLFPNHHALMLREAQILIATGKLSKAIQRLKSIEQIDRSEEVLLTMANVYSQQREHEKAIRILTQVLQSGSSDFRDEIYLEIAFEYQNIERYDRALETLLEAIEKSPDNEVVIYELAYVFDVTERLAESIEFFQEFLVKRPYSMPSWFNLGNAYQKANQLDEAIECYEYAIAITDDFTPAYFSKAHALFKLERYQEAIAVFEETYAHEMPQASVYCHIGECFEKLNQHDKALFYYRKSIETDQHFADAYLGTGITLDLMQKTQEGLIYVERAIELEPDNVDYRLFQIEFFRKLDRFEEAESNMNEMLTRHPDNEDVWIDAGDLYAQQFKWDICFQLVDEGLHKSRKTDELQARYVAYLYMSGSMAKADEHLVLLANQHPEMLVELSDYYPEIKENILFIDLFSKRT